MGTGLEAKWLDLRLSWAKISKEQYRDGYNPSILAIFGHLGAFWLAVYGFLGFLGLLCIIIWDFWARRVLFTGISPPAKSWFWTITVLKA